MATAATIPAAPARPVGPDGKPPHRPSLPQWQTLRLFGRGRHAAFVAGSERKGDL
jgi:hypothetical protein